MPTSRLSSGSNSELRKRHRHVHHNQGGVGFWLEELNVAEQIFVYKSEIGADNKVDIGDYQQGQSKQARFKELKRTGKIEGGRHGRGVEKVAGESAKFPRMRQAPLRRSRLPAI